MGLDAAAAHPAPQLVELGQAKFVGVLDQDRVHPGDVEAALHDGGAEHHIGFAGVERHHGALQFPLGHLAVGHQQFEPGDHRPQLAGHILDALHPRDHIKHLAAAIQLLAQGTADGLLIKGREMGFDRPAQGRRRGDQAHFPNARKAHIEGARNGGG